MAEVGYDDRSFLVDGERIWLVSGSVHYFRTPAALWPDRLLKAKRAGLNCISTYVAWNVHEPSEGQWAVSGDQDLEGFVQLAEELGLYVILRPGPYICAEWDFGGLPGWLAGKSGIAYRTSNAAYTHYYDKYFGQILPRLAEHQVTRGGNIILIQNENEYIMTTMPDRLSYLEFISQLFRRSGFDIPIITCNHFSDPPVPDTIECVNEWQNPVAKLKKLRSRQPDAPLLVTEFWTGWFDQWGGEHHTRCARETARKALEILGCGSQHNYYMWHGGTNFGFWGSRLAGSDTSYQTTSYDYDAPLAESGGLTQKYYLTRLVNILGSTMGRFFAGCTMPDPGVTIHDSTDVLNLSGPLGGWAVVTNNGRDEITTAQVSLPNGKELTVSLEPFGAAAVPVGLKFTPECTLDYANLTPLGLFWDKVLVLHGPVGWEGRISINGTELQATVPDGETPEILEHEELLVVLISSDLGMRTWGLEDTLVFGPSFVGRTQEDVINAPRAKQYAILSSEGKLTLKKIKTVPRRKPTPPRLSAWKRISVCTEPVASGLEWEKIDKPRDADHLGVHYGYLWYRLEIEEPRAKRRYMLLPDCEDRATIYLNGNLLGVWGRGQDATRSPIPGSFKRGRNALTLLVDNLGRFNFGTRLGEVKGLYGHIFDAKPLQTRKPKIRPAETFAKRIVPRALAHVLKQLESMPLVEAQIDITLTKVTPMHMSFTDIPHHVAVLCNSRLAGFFPTHGKNFGDVTLGAELKRGKNVIKLLLWDELHPRVLDNLKFYMLEENISQRASWSFRPWVLPTPGGPIVGKDRPAWYVAKFKYPGAAGPLFLYIVGAKKGQIFLNGHNVGRFWTIGPQESYYLPECWLRPENELMIFEEQGNIPRRSRLEYRPLGPYGE